MLNYSQSANIIFSDAFTRREKGSEDYYIRQHEREKLDAVKQKMGEARKHIADLEKHVYVKPNTASQTRSSPRTSDEISKESGGEHN